MIIELNKSDSNPTVPWLGIFMGTFAVCARTRECRVPAVPWPGISQNYLFLPRPVLQVPVDLPASITAKILSF